MFKYLCGSSMLFPCVREKYNIELGRVNQRALIRRLFLSGIHTVYLIGQSLNTGNITTKKKSDISLFYPLIFKTNLICPISV